MEQHGWRWVAEEGDEVNGPLTTWVEYETAGIMWARLQAGCKLELYAAHEFGMIFWYCEYLLSVMIGTHQQLWRSRPAAAAPAAKTTSKGASNRKKEKGDKGAKKADEGPSDVLRARLEVGRMCVDQMSHACVDRKHGYLSICIRVEQEEVIENEAFMAW